MPEALKNAPVLWFGLALYYNAFFDLDTERDRGELQSIPRSAVFQYAHDYEFDEWQADDLWFHIQRMDFVSLKWQKDRKPPPPEEQRNG